MKEKMLIYHGSDHIVKVPQYGYGKKYNDYGMGFYCTENEDLAKEWAVDRERNGYSNAYELNLADLEVLNLNEGDLTILHWITILLKNRQFDIQTDFGQEAIEYLSNHYSLNTMDADVIIGYRADDSYFSYASDFLNNIISLETLERAMKLGELGEQVVLKSKKAFDNIRFVDATEVRATEWYAAKSVRDSRARMKYKEIKQQPRKKGALYLMEIIDQEAGTDDSRI